MKYCSTRGQVKGLSFEDVLFHTYASDGGLYMPENIPQVDADTSRLWSGFSYVELCKAVTRLFIAEDEIPTVDLNGIISKAFSNRFDLEDIVCFRNLESLSVLELWHGPTLAFKDLALSCIGQFLSYFNKKAKRHITILISTSGDTGSAAIESVRHVDYIDIIVMFPKGRCTAVQERQMTTVLDHNVHVIEVEGIPDDFDTILKNCLGNQEQVKTHTLCSINSINWARIMIQIVHYFYAYFQASKGCLSSVDKVTIVVPTGSAGNMTAGIVAVLMGLPVRLVAATNVNDIFHRGMSTGDFSSCRETIHTLSSAMDIRLPPYNMERMLFLFSDAAKVFAVMKEFEENNHMVVPEEVREKMSHVLTTQSVSREQTLGMVKHSWFHWHYLIDPHTAVAMFAATDQQKRIDAKSRYVVLSTARPDKFPDILSMAGIECTPGEKIQELFRKPTKYLEMKKGDDWDKILLQIICSITEQRKIAN